MEVVPELINDRKIFTLAEVALSIQKTIAERYTTAVWIKAEMNKLNHYTHSGHCYPDLVEKTDGKVTAQMRANLWRNDYLKINANFLKVLKEPLKEGIKILFLATIGFDPVYGLSLRIIDIDPSYSLGELEREKQLTLERLVKEDIYDKNRELRMALLPQRIAIISVETSKGYADFLKVIDGNQFGYAFFHHLFPALLQGERSIPSIIAQLKVIKKVMHHFDVVAIIRGGGGDVGLSSYNNYELSKEIALFPLPVITGIGHATNETIAEMVAYKNAITPTAIANFLLQKFHDFAVPVNEAATVLIHQSERLIRMEQQHLQSMARYLKSVAANTLSGARNSIQYQLRSLYSSTSSLFKTERTGLISIIQHTHKDATLLLHKQQLHLDIAAKTVQNLDPVNILQRGYTITLHNGKSIRSQADVRAGDELVTLTADSSITSTINSIEKNNNL